jgi:hypothetical protein
MAWEVRGGCRYYTRSRKVAGKVVRQYCGTGAEGQLAAALDARRRRERQARRLAVQADRDRWARAEAPVSELDHVTTLLVRAALLGAGFRQHERGEWRKRRDEQCG